MSHYGGPRLRDHIPREMLDTTGYILVAGTKVLTEATEGERIYSGSWSIVVRKAWKLFLSQQTCKQRKKEKASPGLACSCSVFMSSQFKIATPLPCSLNLFQHPLRYIVVAT